METGGRYRPAGRLLFLPALRGRRWLRVALGARQPGASFSSASQWLGGQGHLLEMLCQVGAVTGCRGGLRTVPGTGAGVIVIITVRSGPRWP